MSVIDEILAHNESYAEQFTKGLLPMPPAKKLAAVVCMDARLETGALLRLVEGDAHVIRNAGGVVTDDVVRSLTISQRLLGTREIILLHHTDCGLQQVTEDAFKAELEEELLLGDRSSSCSTYYLPTIACPCRKASNMPVRCANRSWPCWVRSC